MIFAPHDHGRRQTQNNYLFTAKSFGSSVSGPSITADRNPRNPRTRRRMGPKSESWVHTQANKIAVHRSGLKEKKKRKDPRQSQDKFTNTFGNSNCAAWNSLSFLPHDTNSDTFFFGEYPVRLTMNAPLNKCF